MTGNQSAKATPAFHMRVASRVRRGGGGVLTPPPPQPATARGHAPKTQPSASTRKARAGFPLVPLPRSAITPYACTPLLRCFSSEFPALPHYSRLYCMGSSAGSGMVARYCDDPESCQFAASVAISCGFDFRGCIEAMNTTVSAAVCAPALGPAEGCCGVYVFAGFSPDAPDARLLGVAHAPDEGVLHARASGRETVSQ